MKKYKKLLPKSLFGRTLFILLAPLICLQAVMGYVFYERHIEDMLISSAQRTASEIQFIRKQYIKNHYNTYFLQDFKEAFSKRYYIGNLPNSLGECQVSSYIIRQFTEFLQELEPDISVCEYQQDDEYIIIVPFEDQKKLILRAYRKEFLSGKWHFLPVWSLASALILAFIAALFLRNQMRPILRLSKALEAFGRGDHKFIYTPSGAIEIRKAGIDFLKMRQRLIEHINSRTMLMAGVSHDLRTILTRLKLELSLLDDSEEVQNLKSDVKQMQAILDSYFSFINETEGEEAELLDINNEIEQLIKRYQSSATKITFDTDLKQPVMIYKNSFQRCLMNLLSNAQRYGTHICITAQQSKDNMLRVSVEDNGKGVSKENLNKIFEPFFSDNMSRTMSSEDHGIQLGLGLAIVRNIMRSKGGSITANHSEKLGGLKVTMLF